MKLIPIPIRYRLGSYDFDIKYHNGNDFSIETIGVDYYGSNNNIKIDFKQFAEINIFHFNFWEEN